VAFRPVGSTSTKYATVEPYIKDKGKREKKTRLPWAKIKHYSVRLYGVWMYSYVSIAFALKCKRMVRLMPRPLYPGDRTRSGLRRCWRNKVCISDSEEEEKGLKRVHGTTE
jgi:hypothetical protein